VHQVKIGAHPSYPDKVNFGRKVIEMPWSQLESSLNQQIKALTSQLTPQQTLHHIKPHGALYLEMMRNPMLYEKLLRWMQRKFPGIKLVIQAGIHPQTYHRLAEHYQVPLLLEAFADRAYLPNGQLAPRN